MLLVLPIGKQPAMPWFAWQLTAPTCRTMLCMGVQVAKSPLCANMVFEYCITTAGVLQVGEGQELPPHQLASAIDMPIANEWGQDNTPVYE
jgi:hypothetical protein